MATSPVDDHRQSQMDCKEYYSREKTLELRDIYIPYVALRLIVSREISIEFLERVPNFSIEKIH